MLSFYLSRYLHNNQPSSIHAMYRCYMLTDLVHWLASNKASHFTRFRATLVTLEQIPVVTLASGDEGSANIRIRSNFCGVAEARQFLDALSSSVLRFRSQISWQIPQSCFLGNTSRRRGSRLGCRYCS